MNVIEVTNLVKHYGNHTAVDGVSFSVDEGEIFAILGPNGAGKTTTVESISGLRRPDSGTINVLGLDPARDRDALRRVVGVQLQESELPDEIRVWEALDLYASFYPAPRDWERLVEDLGLTDKRNTAFGKLSGGQKQRLSVALALVGNPRIAILDELTTGLDPQARSTSKVTKREKGIWQRRYWEHAIRNDEDFERHVDYIHFNPVKHGHVTRVADWPHSSFHRFVERGLLAPDWGGDLREIQGVFGE